MLFEIKNTKVCTKLEDYLKIKFFYFEHSHFEENYMKYYTQILFRKYLKFVLKKYFYNFIQVLYKADYEYNIKDLGKGVKRSLKICHQSKKKVYNLSNARTKNYIFRAIINT